MIPILGGKVEEGEQSLAVLGQTGDCPVVLCIVFVGEQVDRGLGRGRSHWAPARGNDAEDFVNDLAKVGKSGGPYHLAYDLFAAYQGDLRKEQAA